MPRLIPVDILSSRRVMASRISSRQSSPYWIDKEVHELFEYLGLVFRLQAALDPAGHEEVLEQEATLLAPAAVLQAPARWCPMARWTWMPPSTSTSMASRWCVPAAVVCPWLPRPVEASGPTSSAARAVQGLLPRLADHVSAGRGPADPCHSKAADQEDRGERRGETGQDVSRP